MGQLLNIEKAMAKRIAKFRVGEEVYTYESKTQKVRIVQCWDQGVSDGIDWGFHYKCVFPEFGEEGKWIKEDPSSISRKPLA